MVGGSDPSILGATIQEIELDDNVVTDDKIATHTSTKIVGLAELTDDINFSVQDALDVGELNLNDRITLVIATGVITITQSYHQVDTEAAASTDNLDTINSRIGTALFLKGTSPARDPTFIDAAPLVLSGNFTFDTDSDSILLVSFSATISVEYSRSNNA